RMPWAKAPTPGRIRLCALSTSRGSRARLHSTPIFLSMFTMEPILPLLKSTMVIMRSPPRDASTCRLCVEPSKMYLDDALKDRLVQSSVSVLHQGRIMPEQRKRALVSPALFRQPDDCRKRLFV